MNRRWAYGALLVMLMVLAGCGRSTRGERVAVELGGRTFDLELALDDAAREHGLMERDHIADDGGMLFVFPRQQVLRFWMKNCKVPIDVIFLDAAGRIVSIHQMTPPAPGTADRDLAEYPSGYPAQFAIEVQGGLTDKLGLKLGEKVDLELESLKQRAR